MNRTPKELIIEQLHSIRTLFDDNFDPDEKGAADIENALNLLETYACVLPRKQIKKNWLDYLPADVCERLGNCITPRRDLQTLVNAKWAWYKDTGKDKEGFTKEDALKAE